MTGRRYNVLFIYVLATNDNNIINVDNYCRINKTRLYNYATFRLCSKYEIRSNKQLWFTLSAVLVHYRSFWILSRLYNQHNTAKTMSKVLEVCIESIESALAAINGGAGRLELCSSLTDGGTTPTPGFLVQIKNLIKNTAVKQEVKVYCLLRCRPGDFTYTEQELAIMKDDAKFLRENGADGFVFGALSKNGTVNEKVCREIIKACQPLPVTFHRAFDFCKQQAVEVERIIELGFERVETSAKQKSAQTGVKVIKQLIEQVGKRIIVMPGGGVNKDNLKFIMDHTGAVELHGTFKKKVASDQKPEEENSEAIIGERVLPLYVTDQAAVAEIVNIMKSI